LRPSLIDEFNQVTNGVIRDQIRDEVPTELAEVVEYDHVNHTAKVRPIRSLGFETISARVQVHYQGQKSGTGEAHALYPGDYVRVAFIGGERCGIISSAEVIGRAYVKKGQQAPAYGPWHDSGKGTVTVNPRKGDKFSFGNATFVDDDSNVYRTNIGDVHEEDWGSHHSVANGSNMSMAEKKIRTSAELMAKAVDVLLG
jgi:hypothetical protein